jgi:hypothetical protein
MRAADRLRRSTINTSATRGNSRMTNSRKQGIVSLKPSGTSRGTARDLRSALTADALESPCRASAFLHFAVFDAKTSIILHHEDWLLYSATPRSFRTGQTSARRVPHAVHKKTRTNMHRGRTRRTPSCSWNEPRQEGNVGQVVDPDRAGNGRLRIDAPRLLRTRVDRRSYFVPALHATRFRKCVPRSGDAARTSAYAT